MSKDTEGTAPVAATEAPAAASPAPAEQQISLALPEPAAMEPPVAEQTIASPPIGAPKVIKMPKPVEAVLKAVEAVKSAQLGKPAPGVETIAPLAAESAPPPVAVVPGQSQSHKFAMLAASVAFAGCVGAMAGALAASVIARSGAAQSPLAALDLTSIQDTVAALRTELSSIKSSVDGATRNSNAQFARFNERLERIDRAQAAPAAQLKQAMEAIERLERRAQASTEATGSVRPQPATAAGPATTAPAPSEPPRQTVLDGWVVRHVSRGVAVIQGRRIGAIEVEAGDIVPGIGRIEFDQAPGGPLGCDHFEGFDQIGDGADDAAAANAALRISSIQAAGARGSSRAPFSSSRRLRGWRACRGGRAFPAIPCQIGSSEEHRA